MSPVGNKFVNVMSGLYFTYMDGDLTIWKRIILWIIGVVVAIGIIASLFAWYQYSHLGQSPVTDQIASSTPIAALKAVQQAQLRSLEGNSTTTMSQTLVNIEKAQQKADQKNTPAPTGGSSDVSAEQEAQLKAIQEAQLKASGSQ
jgi:hypothetical protein